MNERERPYLSLRSTDRDPAEEHHDSAELLVQHHLKTVVGEVFYAVTSTLKEVSERVVTDVSKRIMDVAYRTPPNIVAEQLVKKINDHADSLEPRSRVDRAYVGGLRKAAGLVEDVDLGNLLNLPSLMGVSEAADFLGCTSKRVSQLKREHPDFPKPIIELRMGPVWLADDIEAFGRIWTRMPGRPVRKPTKEMWS